MSKRRKYSYELKRQVVMEYLAGKGSYRSLAAKYQLADRKNVRVWVNQYRVFGEEGLFRVSSKKQYPLELKLLALELHATTELSMREIANTLRIKNAAEISTWKRSYEKYGIAGLKRKVGRPRMNPKPPPIEMGKAPPKGMEHDEQELRDKIRELEYELRLAKIKNEYLELLRSLGQDERKKKQESSTNSENDTN